MATKERPRDAWAIIVERGYSEDFIAKIGNVDSLKFLNPALQRWLASESDIGIVTTPIREGAVNIRTAFLPGRDELPEGIQMITSYFADYIGSGKRLTWAQGGQLSAETKQIIQDTLGTLPGPWAFN